MPFIITILSVFAAYLVFNIACGIILAVVYRIKEKRITDNEEFFKLLLFPATGLGNWRYNRNIRNNMTEPYGKKWHVYKNMIYLNWLFVLLVVGYECYFFIHLYQLYHQYSTAKSDAAAVVGSTGSEIIFKTFGWMIDISFTFMMVFIIFLLLFTFGIFYFLFIFLPKLQLSGLARKLKQ